MRHQSGNFMVQALLALTLVFAMIPFVAQKLVQRNTQSMMYSTTRQIEHASASARIFIRENAKNLSYDRTVIAGESFGGMLEPYGLPLGYVPRTALGQDIVLIIDKTPTDITAYLELTGGDLSEIQKAELARRIGFCANYDPDGVYVGIALSENYSDVVRRNEPDIDNSAFLTDLDMGDFVFDNAGNVFSSTAEFDTAQIGNLTISGTETGRKAKNEIKSISATKTVFQNRTGESALTLTRGTLQLGSLSARTIANFGDTGSITLNSASVYDFSMTAGRSAFTGPTKWDIHGNVVTDNVNFSVERLDIKSYLNVARGQDVYIDEDTLEYSGKSGIEAGTIYTSNITVRDQTSTGLSYGASGAVILDVRPAGTSYLPDALVDTINNDKIEIIQDVIADTGDTTSCKDIITKLEGKYNPKSLSQHIICQYVFWQRLERRINIKQCLMAGGSDCI